MRTQMFALFSLLFAVCALAEETSNSSLVPTGPCKEWCQGHCESECKKKGFGSPGVTGECRSESACYCTCPGNNPECTDEWCQKFCTQNGGGKKFESHCKDKDTCQCKFESTDGATMTASSSSSSDKKP